MIIVDASVVIDYIRSQDPKLQTLLLALPVAICGVTRAEVLCGSRDPAHRRRQLCAQVYTTHQQSDLVRTEQEADREADPGKPDDRCRSGEDRLFQS